MPRGSEEQVNRAREGELMDNCSWAVATIYGSRVVVAI